MKTKNLLFALLMLIYISNITSAQITFQKTFGGIHMDEATSIQQTSDGGYIIAGLTSSFGAGNSEIYLIKTTANGDTLWTKSYGGTDDDYGTSVQQTSDGGYIITGLTFSFGLSSNDVYLIKTTANGNTLWSKTFGGIDYDYGSSVQQTTDGGYIIAGETKSFGAGNNDVYLIKTTTNGDTLWTKTFGGTGDDWGKSVQQTADGGYIIAGETSSYGTGGYDVYLIKTTANGDTLWTKTYGGTNEDKGKSVQQTTDGGYIIAGYTRSFGAGFEDVYLIKTTANGDTLWTKTFGGTGMDIGQSVQQTNDGGYVIAGGTGSFGAGSNDVYLIKTTANGNTLWTKTFGGTGNDWAYSVQQTADSGYIIAGITDFTVSNGDFFSIKTDANGNSGCNQGNPATITGNTTTHQTSPPTIIHSTATIVSTPTTMLGSGGTISTLCITTGISELNPNSENITIYPNPVQEEVNISLQPNSKAAIIRIYNIYGAIVREALINKSVTTISLNDLTDGLYLYHVTDINGDILDTGKIMKE